MTRTARLIGKNRFVRYRGRVSWFGRKKREKTPDEAPAPEVKDESAPKPFSDVEGDIVEHATGPLAQREPPTGSFRVQVNDATEADAVAESVGEIEPDTDADSLDIGLMPVYVSEPTREEMLEEAIARWRHSLSDLDSGHDFLTDMRAAAHLDLTHSHPQGLAHLLATRSATRLSALVREPDALANARDEARHIREIAQAHAEERGLTTCYLGIGEATWYGSSGRDIHAPILLRPMNLHPRGNAREDVDLALDSAVDLNPMLLRALRDEGVLIDARALLALTRSHHGFDPQPVLDAFRSLGEPLPGFRVNHALVVGTLVDASGPLLADFDVPTEDLAHNTLIAALAGDAEATLELSVGETVRPSSRRVNSQEPEADGDQTALASSAIDASADPDARAISEALGTQAAIAVHTPPGSPSTATLISYVTEELARGKRVLLLSQRASKLNELREAVESAGLSDVLLSLIPDPQLQRGASEAMLHSLAKASSFVAPVSLDEPDGLDESRDVLIGHVEAMHRVQQPWGVSAHEAINALAELARRRPAPRTSVRLSPDVAERMIQQRDHYRRLFMDADESGAIAMKPEDSSWFGASITSDTQAARALTLIDDLHGSLLPKLHKHAVALGTPIDLTAPETLFTMTSRVKVLEDMRDLFRRVRPEIFHEDIPRMIAAFQDKSYREQHSLTMGFGERRRWKKLARDLMQPSAQNDEIPALLGRSLAVRDRWHTCGPVESARPTVPEALDSIADDCASAQKVCDELKVLLSGTPEGTDFENTDLTALTERVARLKRDRGILDVLPHRTTLVRTLEFEGFGDLVADLRDRNVSGNLVLAELELAWWVSVLEFIARAEPTLSQYDGTKLSQVAERYRRLDEEYMRAGRYRVRSHIDSLLVDTMKRFPDTSRSAIRELNGAATSSVKETAAKYQDIMFRARPLWLASPYMVPQMIPAGEHFDLVVFADSSTLPTAAAVPAIARARQAVVAGDPFEYAATADDSETQSFLLDDVSAIAPIMRVSRDHHPATGGVRRFVSELARRTHSEWEAISAPPSPEQVDDDSYVYVPEGRGAVSQGTEYIESTHAELERVTDLVIYHARNTPERSLAIITLTPAHAWAVFDRVMRTVSTLPDLTDFFSANAQEYFAVVPVEYASTIERDDIIVSLGFGLTPHDRLLHRFGPLSGEHGRRALMSALTKARARTSIVSAVRTTDIDPERVKSEGARDYRALLEFLESGMDPNSLLADVEPEGDVASGKATASTATVVGESVPTDERYTDATGAANAASAHDTASVDDAASADGSTPADDTSAADDPAVADSVQVDDAHADNAEADNLAAAEARSDNNPADHDETDADGSTEPKTHDSSGALVADLADRLWRMGYTVEVDYGLTAERVELAVGHPDLPGRHLVAVMTDGPRYREISDQRERDRLMAERLEHAGWSVERVWSWALFIDPEGEAERVTKTIERAYQEYLDYQDELRLRGGSPRHRLPRPKVPAGHPLSFYGPEDFDAVVAYICSDGKARMAEQLAAEVREFLAFDTRTVLLDVSISSAIRRYLEAQQDTE